MGVREMLLDPDVLNSLVEPAVKHLEDTLRLLMENIAPKGRVVTQEELRDKRAELAEKIFNHDQHLSVASDPNALPGDRTRANRELLREQELREELFGAQLNTP